MAEIIPWAAYEFKRIEFDNCTSAGPHFRIGVFTSAAAKWLAPARATAQEARDRERRDMLQTRIFAYIEVYILG